MLTTTDQRSGGKTIHCRQKLKVILMRFQSVERLGLGSIARKNWKLILDRIGAKRYDSPKKLSLFDVWYAGLFSFDDNARDGVIGTLAGSFWRHPRTSCGVSSR
jgi:hypothetical protein